MNDRDRRVLLRVAPVCAALVAIVWIAAVGFRAGWWRTGNVDRGWAAVMAATDQPWLHGVAQVLAVIGTGTPALLMTAVLALAIALRQGAVWALPAIAIPAIDSAQVSALKAIAGRLRPDSAYGFANAFPSGHTALAAALATVAGVLLLEGRARIMAAAYPVVMGWSRTQLGAHWLSDVLAGAVLGASTALVLLIGAGLLLRRFGRGPSGRVERPASERGGRPLRARGSNVRVGMSLRVA